MSVNYRINFTRAFSRVGAERFGWRYLGTVNAAGSGDSVISRGDNAMNLIIIVIGIIFCLIGIAAMASPRFLIGQAKSIRMSTPLRLFGAFLRIALGIIFILAPGTRYPLAMEIIGALILVAGILLIFLKNAWIQSLIDWVYARPPYCIRAGGFFGLVFGLFLVYANF